MKWPQLKEIVTKEFAVRAMGVLYVVIKVLDKIQKEETKDIRMFKVPTKHHHVILVTDNAFTGSCILVKKRGILQEWYIMDETDVPACLVQDIFDQSCPKEKRKRLVSKMMGLKAFW